MGALKRYSYLVSTVLLVLLFGAAGVFNVLPIFIDMPGNDMPNQFRRFVHIPPLSYLKVHPDLYMFSVGLSELIAAGIIILASRGGRAQTLATYYLGIVMIGAAYTHAMVGDPVEKFGGVLMGSVLVLVRLYSMNKLKLKFD
ncbi:PREDICTED: uncharacterized protein LOC109586653 [Amphimedon queenslandica]|uniref:DoxX family protein n=1 Tax=Amphimedon queenslandica TaxID=400682 RepID=A0AAN0JN36_AMPQE|nr:PREDICTED: uncharacterized protein LOC109586653 [Amphimedon queenslandica]|eukprot:XP_019858417.1 PREDICTED: uncharacterized protein LOC109586653 [Amphimedon queenslandica]